MKSKIFAIIAIVAMSVGGPANAATAEYEGETGYWCGNLSDVCKKGDMIFVGRWESLTWCDLSKQMTPFPDDDTNKIICVHRGEARKMRL